MAYFVRIRGKAFGPFDEEQLKEMKTKGKLGKTTEISENKMDWQLAGDLDFLFPPSATGPQGGASSGNPGHPGPEISRPPREPADWFYSVNGTEGYGPVTRSAIVQMLQAGTLQGSSLVWQQGQNARPIKTESQFAVPAPPPRQSYPQQSPATPNAPLFCAACGNPVVATAQMCPKCGSPVIRHQQPFSSPGTNPSYTIDHRGTGYFDVLKKYAQFSGRARRREYWNFYLVNILIYILVIVIAAVLGVAIAGSDPDTGAAVAGFVFVLYYIYALGIFLPSLAVCVRRLHDVGQSGWMIFISLIPLVGPIILLVFLVQDSQPGSNYYGPNPKYPT